MWRRYLIDWPARCVDWLWIGYVTLIAALAVLCVVNVALLLAGFLLGFRLFL